MKNIGHGIANGYLVLETVIKGRFPSFFHKRLGIIRMDPYTEYLVQTEAGKFNGRGSTTFKINEKESIPIQ